MPFSLHYEPEADEEQRGRLVASGEIDVAVADEFAETGVAAVQQIRIDSLVIDLSGVTFMDSTGLSALVKIRNAAVDLSKQISLCNVPSQVLQILTITGLDTVLPIVNGPESTTAGRPEPA